MSSTASSLCLAAFTRNSYEFVSVRKESPHFPLITDIFKNKLESVYGNQDFNLERFESGKSRTCKVLLKDGIPVGLIAYLTELQRADDLTASLEVRNLYVFNPEENVGRGYENKLFRRIQDIARKLSAQGIHVPTPKNDLFLTRFLTQKNFSTKDKGDKTLFYCRFPERIVVEQTESSSSSSSSNSGKRARPAELQIEETPRKSHRRYEEQSAGDHQRERMQKKQSPVHESTNTERETSGSPKSHEITLREPYISQIRQGRKTIEGRINGGIVLQYKEGDTIRFFEGRNPRNDVTCRITRITTFRSFREMLQASGFQKCLPEVRSLEEAVEIYDRIPGYAERASRSGVRALHVELIPRH